MKRAIILVLDSLGIGAAKDADKFGDLGSNTLGNIAKACARGLGDNEQRSGHLQLPNLNQLGLGKACEAASGYYPEGLDSSTSPIASYGYAGELSSGKDTPSGHWEIAGVPVLFDWGYFSNKENSFPTSLTDRILARAGLDGFLGNCHSSGTKILDQLGVEHMQSGKPIFYTSADSVFQIACHEETFGLDRLLNLCQIAREELADYNIGRVIARPFIGQAPGSFSRTGNRRDFSLSPPSPTVLDKVVAVDGNEVIAIGKIADIYANCGVSKKIKATGLCDLFETTLSEVKSVPKSPGIIFTNFVDFDSEYGHRRDVAGYAAALEYFDKRLPELISALAENDILIITADHGCDPTSEGTDHTREYIPVLVYGKSLPSTSIGYRSTFADIGQSLAEYFGVSEMNFGKSFL